MAMITSSENAGWPGDMPLQDLEAAGLPVRCRVRMKLFTLDNRLILRKSGALGPEDRAALAESIRATMPL